MKTKLHSLYESEGYRIESMKSDSGMAQVDLRWDGRYLPRCEQCGVTMRINRITRQSAQDVPLGPAVYVGLIYDAVQGYCKNCRKYGTVRPLGIVERHKATLRLMRQTSLLCRWMPVTSVCEVTAVTPASAYRHDRYILQTELPEPCLEGLDALLIDEKHLGKAGYVTLVLNAHTGELLWIGVGRGQDALQEFFHKLGAERCAGILAVGMDRSGGYLAAVNRHLPNAEPVFDKFHLVANLNEVIDKVRRRTQKEANEEGRAFIKGQRYNLFRNPENLSKDGAHQLNLLLEANRDLSVVYMLKDAFKCIWTYSYRRCAEKRLDGWIEMAMESGVAELQRFAGGLEKAKDNILSFCKHRITSARIEAFNCVVSKVMHKACGVNNLDFLFLKLRQESLQW